MTKNDLIKIVQGADATQATKNMVIEYILVAYDAGYIDGMKRGVEIERLIEEQLQFTIPS